MKKILIILFVVLGINLQQSFAQNDSVVLPDYMYKRSTFEKVKSGNENYLTVSFIYGYDSLSDKFKRKTFFTIRNKKPVNVYDYVLYKNGCNLGYFLENETIVTSFALNDNECIIFTKYMEFYKFTYSDSSIVKISDLIGDFNENRVNGFKKGYQEVVDFDNGCLHSYCEFRGLQLSDVGRMWSGNLVKIDSTWFLSFEYFDFNKTSNIRVLIKSNDLKNWDRCKVHLNYKYKKYNESLKTFVPFLFTYEDYDVPLKNSCKINGVIYFSDSDRLIYKSVDNGTTFKLYKVFRPFPEPVVPTFENTNH
jgi:hypothetical protein